MEVGVWYAYRVHAVNLGGETYLGSGGVRKTKIQVVQPGAPDNRSASAHCGTVTVTWDAVPGATA